MRPTQTGVPHERDLPDRAIGAWGRAMVPYRRERPAGVDDGMVSTTSAGRLYPDS